jgi:hypothetical protein
MSDSLKLYRTIIDMLMNTRIHFYDFRCLVTFAWAIVGVLLENRIRKNIDRLSRARAESPPILVQWLRNAR